jgi:D-alanine-D-alanine ligase
VQILPRERRFFDYHSKYTEGATFYLVPAPLPPDLYQKVQQEALKAFESLDCEGFGRVDLILKNEDVFILEVNTIPGLTRLSLLPKAALAAGMEFEELVEKIMRLALR